MNSVSFPPVMRRLANLEKYEQAVIQTTAQMHPIDTLRVEA